MPVLRGGMGQVLQEAECYKTTRGSFAFRDYDIMIPFVFLHALTV